jgi:hypothetical protein
MVGASLRIIPPPFRFVLRDALRERSSEVVKYESYCSLPSPQRKARVQLAAGRAPKVLPSHCERLRRCWSSGSMVPGLRRDDGGNGISGDYKGPHPKHDFASPLRGLDIPRWSNFAQGVGDG